MIQYVLEYRFKAEPSYDLPPNRRYFYENEKNIPLELYRQRIDHPDYVDVKFIKQEVKETVIHGS